ncbi:MAG: metal-dependent hydrolase, partial [Lachnospiraceae bacterium]|nr:metal-dependent hydrolase [Lachnospiraceae bacterium]
MAKKADTIIYGNIYTVDKKQPEAAAAAIADGRFIYVGDEAGAREYIAEGTRELRYDKGIILPGFGE